MQMKKSQLKDLLLVPNQNRKVKTNSIRDVVSVSFRAYKTEQSK